MSTPYSLVFLSCCAFCLTTVLACQSGPEITASQAPGESLLDDAHIPVVQGEDTSFANTDPVVLRWRLDAPIGVSSGGVLYRIRLARNAASLTQKQCPTCITATHVGDPDDEVRFEPELGANKAGEWFWSVRSELQNHQVSPWSQPHKFTVKP